MNTWPEGLHQCSWGEEKLSYILEQDSLVMHLLGDTRKSLLVHAPASKNNKLIGSLSDTRVESFHWTVTDVLSKRSRCLFLSPQEKLMQQRPTQFTAN